MAEGKDPFTWGGQGQVTWHVTPAVTVVTRGASAGPSSPEGRPSEQGNLKTKDP